MRKQAKLAAGESGRAARRLECSFACAFAALPLTKLVYARAQTNPPAKQVTLAFFEVETIPNSTKMDIAINSVKYIYFILHERGVKRKF